MERQELSSTIERVRPFSPTHPLSPLLFSTLLFCTIPIYITCGHSFDTPLYPHGFPPFHQMGRRSCGEWQYTSTRHLSSHREFLIILRRYIQLLHSPHRRIASHAADIPFARSHLCYHRFGRDCNFLPQLTHIIPFRSLFIILHLSLKAFKIWSYIWIYTTYVMEPTGGWSSELNVKRFIIYNIIGDVLGVSLVFKKTTSLCCSKIGAACPQSIPSVSVVHSRQLPPCSLTRARNTLTSSFLGQLDQRHFGIQV